MNYIKLNAVDGILFRGFAGDISCVAQKPLLNNIDEDKTKNPFLEKVYGKQNGYNEYVISINKVEDILVQTNTKLKTYSHSYSVAINKDLLINDLLNAGLIKPLTNGF